MNQEVKKILIIDDNSDIRDLVQFIFEKAGLTVIHGKNGEKGLAQLRALRPDVVLLDTTMPGISGLEVLKEIRNDEDRDLRRIPVMMLTANSAEDDIAQALELGASSYVIKPFKKEKIVAAVELLLKLEQV